NSTAKPDNEISRVLQQYPTESRRQTGDSGVPLSANRRHSISSINERGRQLRRPYYLRRLRSHASLISKTTTVTMVVTTIGPANIATSVSIFHRGGWRPDDRSQSLRCDPVSACCALRIVGVPTCPSG